jgi:hypothetical protein
MTAWSATNKNANVGLTGGNLIATGSGTGGISFPGRCDTSIGAGQSIYWEVVVGGSAGVGICTSSETFNNDDFPGHGPNSLGWFGDGNIWYNFGVIATGPTYSSGDRLMIACQGGGSGKIWFGVNGVWSGDPSAGTGGQGNGFVTVFPVYNVHDAESATVNFGTTTLTYATPTGFTTFDTPSLIVDVVPGEAIIEGRRADVAGVPGLEVLVIPGVIEIVGTSPLVSGTFEAVDVVPGVIEVVGSFPQINANAYTLAATGSSYAITGTAATLTVGGLKVIASAGSYVITGTAAGLSTGGRKVVAGAGAYAVTGSTATLIYLSRRVYAGIGAYDITGTAATLRFAGFSSTNIPLEGFPVIEAYLTGTATVSPSLAGRNIVSNLYIGNSNRIEVQGLRNGITGEFLNGATAFFSVYRDGLVISGGSNIAMEYVAGSNGRYAGVLPETADLTTASHTVTITVDAGDNADAFWTIRIKPSLRAAA